MVTLINYTCAFLENDGDYLLLKRAATFQKMIQHYLVSEPDCQTIYVGTAENVNGKLKMCWAEIEDFND